MEYQLLKKENIKTLHWAGGDTHEIVIYPFSSLYKDRDFIFRISFADCLTDSSDFTPLPDYDRKLSLINGEIKLKLCDKNSEIKLSPYEIFSFGGEEKIQSFGRCRDFNLMTRKGIAEGELFPFEEGNLSYNLNEGEFICIFVTEGFINFEGEQLSISSMEGILLNGAAKAAIVSHGRGFISVIRLK